MQIETEVVSSFTAREACLMPPVKWLTICHISLQFHFVANYQDEYVGSEWVNVNGFSFKWLPIARC